MLEKKDDFNKEEYTTKIEGLEKFREEFSGKNFDKKVCESIKESREIECEIKKIIWEAIRTKIVWIIIGGSAVIFTDLIIRAIPSILKSL